MCEFRWLVGLEKDGIDSLPLALRTKNDIYKFLKSILNFGVKWYGFNFIDVYNKMTKLMILLHVENK